MSIFGRLFRPAEAKASTVGSVISERQLGQPVWTGRDFTAFAREAYQINPIGYRGVRMIATAAATIPIVAHNSAGDLLESHPFIDLLKRPNPARGQVSFLEAFFSFLMLSGNAYIEAVGPTGKEPAELWVQRSDRMRVVPGKFGMPALYEYKVDGKAITWRVNPSTGESKILHVKEFHPTDDWYGLSRIEAGASGIDRNNAAAAHNKALLDNGAVPSGALVMKPIVVNGTAKSAPQPVIDAAQKKLDENHAGPRNAGKPMVLSGDVEWVGMGQSAKDMDFHEGKDDAGRDALIALGVPPILIMKGESTYNNRREAKLEFYEENIIPLVRAFLDDASAWGSQLYAEPFQLHPDLDKVSALEPRRERKRESTAKLVDSKIITVDEAREDLQYEPLPDDAIRNIDPQIITALVSASEVGGIDPLIKYMRSVRLYDDAKTDAQILIDALALIEDEPEDDDNLSPGSEEDESNA